MDLDASFIDHININKQLFTIAPLVRQRQHRTLIRAKRIRQSISINCLFSRLKFNYISAAVAFKQLQTTLFHYTASSSLDCKCFISHITVLFLSTNTPSFFLDFQQTQIMPKTNKELRIIHAQVAIPAASNHGILAEKSLKLLVRHDINNVDDTENEIEYKSYQWNSLTRV